MAIWLFIANADAQIVQNHGEKNVLSHVLGGGDRPNRPPPWIRPCRPFFKKLTMALLLFSKFVKTPARVHSGSCTPLVCPSGTQRFCKNDSDSSLESLTLTRVESFCEKGDSSRVTIFLNVTRVESESPKTVTRFEACS